MAPDYRCGLDVFIAPLGGVIGKSIKLLEDFMHWHLPFGSSLLP